MVSSIVVPVLTSELRVCPDVPLATQAESSRGDVDPQVHKGMLRPSNTWRKGE